MAFKKQTISGGGGQSPVTFKKGALHAQLGVPQGEKIPPAKMAAAKAGRYGPLAQRRANFATGMLAAGRATASQSGAVKRLKRGR